MGILTKNKSKNWEEKARLHSRKLYYLEFTLFVLSLVSTVFLSFHILADAGYFKKTMVLLFCTGGISSFHLLFQKLWDLWAELHDRMTSTAITSLPDAEEEVLPVIQSSIKIVFSCEDETFRKKHISFLQNKVSSLSGRPCEVIETKTALETVSYVTDHVVHLVILDSHYQNELCFPWAEKIKKVDKNIPVIVCSIKEKQTNSNIDAWFHYLQRDTDIEKLLPYFLSSQTINVTRVAKT